MKKRKNIPVRLLAILSFALALAEGWFYYGDLTQFPLLTGMMILQNAVKTFLVSPMITPQMIANELSAGATQMEYLIAHAYCMAILIAPLCTAAAMFSALSYLLRRKVSASIHNGTDTIYLFGWNENVQVLLKNRKNRYAEEKRSFFRPRLRYQEIVHIVTEEEIPEEAEMRYLQEGVFFHTEDCLLLPKENLKTFLERIRLSTGDKILLLESSDSRNLSLYWAIRKCEVELHKQVTFYLACENDATRRVIEECEKVNRKQTETDKRTSLPADLKVFSLAELKTKQIYLNTPLYTYNITDLQKSEEPNWDVHLLIAGFGTIGKQVLRQTLQLGVISCTNEILIDVVDKNAAEERSILESLFRDECLITDQVPENEIWFSNQVFDGTLKIRFHQLDIRGNGFPRKLKELSGTTPFTYIAICTQNADVTMHCMTEVENFLQEYQQDGRKTPVAVRLEFERQIAEHLNEDYDRFAHVFPVAANQDVLTFEDIFDLETERECRAFNYLYDKIYETVIRQHKKLRLSCKADELCKVADNWQTLPYYKKEGNRWLSRHGEIKKMLLLYREWRTNPAAKDSFDTYLKANEGNLKKTAARVLGKACREENVFSVDKDFFGKTGKAGAELIEYAKLEHRRWCYFMAMTGWSYTDGDKDEQRRVSPYFCRWEELQKKHSDVCVNDLIPLMILIWLQEDEKQKTENDSTGKE